MNEHMGDIVKFTYAAGVKEHVYAAALYQDANPFRTLRPTLSLISSNLIESFLNTAACENWHGWGVRGLRHHSGAGD